MASLLSLPIEMFQAIMEWLALTVSLQDVVKLRLVCTLFDIEVQRAVYDLLIFDCIEASRNTLGSILPVNGIGLPMTTRLLLTKLKSKNAHRRPFCVAVHKTLDVLEDIQPAIPDKRETYMQVLIKEAASSRSLRRLVRDLEQSPTPVDDPNMGLQHALVVACSMRDADLAKSLLENGASLIPNIPFFGSAAAVAAKLGSEVLVRILLDHKTNGTASELTETTSRIVQTTMLKFASIEGHVQVVRLILKDENGSVFSRLKDHSPLPDEVEGGHESIAKLLYREQTRPARGDGALRSPFAYLGQKFWATLHANAARYDRQQTMRVLLQHRYTRFPNWMVPLISLAIRHGHADMVDILLSKADLFNMGPSPIPLLEASKRGACELVDKLLAFEKVHGRDINAMKWKWDEHPLVAAAQLGQVHMVRHLLANEINLETLHCGSRALIQAASRGFNEIVRTLLGVGVDVGFALRPFNDLHDITDMKLARIDAMSMYPETFQLLLEVEKAMVWEGRIYYSATDTIVR